MVVGQGNPEDAPLVLNDLSGSIISKVLSPWSFGSGNGLSLSCWLVAPLPSVAASQSSSSSSMSYSSDCSTKGGSLSWLYVHGLAGQVLC